MLKGKTRIPPVDVETLPDDLREVLEEQRKLRGAPLYPYLFYARNPAYFRAAQQMFATLQQRDEARARYAQGAAQPSRRRVERLRVLTGRPCCREQQARHINGKDRGAQRLRE